MGDTENGYVVLDGGKMYYEMGGEGEALVLYHAGFVDSGMWDYQWSDFTQHCRVIRCDMRGFGESGPVQGPVSRRHDLYCLLDHLGIERAALLGCSMGGEAVIDFALEYPEMVAALISVSAVPSGFELEGEPPPYLLEMLAAMEQGDLRRASELQLRIWVDGPLRQPEQVDPAVRRHAAVMNLGALTNGTWGEADAQPLDPPAAGRLGELRIPTLVVAGALDHPEIRRAADLIAAKIIGAEKVIIPGSAHVPNMEKPVEFNRAVVSFLGGVA